MSGKLFLDNGLGRNTRMVAARNVQCRELPHTVPSNQGIFYGEGESVSNVEFACHLKVKLARSGAIDASSSTYIGWRNSDNVFSFRFETTVLLCLGFEQVLFLPETVPTRFHDFGQVSFVEFVVEWLQNLLLSSWNFLDPNTRLNSSTIFLIETVFFGSTTTFMLFLLRLLCLLLFLDSELFGFQSLLLGDRLADNGGCFDMKVETILMRGQNSRTTRVKQKEQRG